MLNCLGKEINLKNMFWVYFYGKRTTLEAKI